MGHLFSLLKPLYSTLIFGLFEDVLCLEIAGDKQVVFSIDRMRRQAMHPPPLLPLERIIS